MKSHSALYKVTIAPAATININATGSAIFVRLAAQVFRITLDGGQTIDAEEGFDYVGVEREKFTRLELSNPNAESLDVELFVSDGTVRRGPLRFSRDAPTIIGGSSGEYTIMRTGGGGSGLIILVLPAAPVGIHRKHIILDNQHASIRLEVYKKSSTGNLSTGSAVMQVPGGQARLIATSEGLVVKNTSTTIDVTLNVAELIYV